jgi:hypothetical protein
MKRNLVIAFFVLVLIVVTIVGFNSGNATGNIFVEVEKEKDWGVSYLVEFLNEDNERLGREVKVTDLDDEVKFSYSENARSLRLTANLVDSESNALFDSSTIISYKSVGFLKNSCESEGDFKSSGKLVVLCDIKNEQMALSFSSIRAKKKQTNKIEFNRVTN